MQLLPLVGVKGIWLRDWEERKEEEGKRGKEDVCARLGHISDTDTHGLSQPLHL